MHLRLIICCFWSICFAAFGQVASKEYHFPDNFIDVVIVSHPKDQLTIDYCIKGIRNNCRNIRRVIVVSSQRLTKKAEWFNEGNFPFTKEDVAFQIGREDQKTMDLFFKWGHQPGWYYQQLLKLYAAYVIPKISSNVLVIDADSVFLNPVKFLNKSGGGLLCTSRNRQTKKRYIKHAQRLVPDYTNVNPEHNSVHHHMLFQKPILNDLFKTVEEYHGMPFWKAFCRCVDLDNGGGASEYEIYYNFALTHTNQVELRYLKRRSSKHLKKIKEYQKRGYHLVSFHSYMRK